MWRIKESIIWSGLIICLYASSGIAKDLPISAFFGTFKGGGIAENRDSIYFKVTVRDFDVNIQPTENGFRVEWTAIIRRGGDPNNPTARKKSHAVEFLPTNKTGVFRAADQSNPLTGGEFIWSRLEAQSLYIYILIIDAMGLYDMQIYQRTINLSGMELIFQRIRDGENIRTVKGRLIKMAN